MIRKLAEELALGPQVHGTNDIRPENPGTPPALKPDMQGPFTDLVVQRHADTKQGELGRAFGEFAGSVGDYKNTIGALLSAKVEEISGSTAASQAAARNRRSG